MGRPMRGKNLFKLLKTLDLLSRPQGTTIEEMAEVLEIDRRSVYRIIKLVEELGFPVYDEAIPLERQKRWKLEESYLKKLPNMKIPDIQLTLPEIISLYLLKGEAGLYKGTEIEGQIQSAFEKLGLFVPKDTFSQLEKIKALFIAPAKMPKDYSGKERIIEQLTEAILQSKTCNIKYHSFYDDKVKHFKIDPLHFVENKGGLYLFVRATTFEEIRILAVERIQEVSISPTTFTYPENFNPEEFLETAFDLIWDDPVKVKIWFSADQARYIKERKWSKNQKIKTQKDGSIILTMDTSGKWDVKKWILSWGSDAMALEPDDLKKEIMDELASSLDFYGEA
jgi:predicted DNA-binding transcriptional regulator YafY